MASCTAGLNIWNEPISFACGMGDPVGMRAGWLGRVLTRLETVDADRAYHRHLTNPNGNHCEAAAEAADSFKDAWTDDDMKAWWDKTQRFLRDPVRWTAGFAAYDPPPSPDNLPR